MSKRALLVFPLLLLVVGSAFGGQTTVPASRPGEKEATTGTAESIGPEDLPEPTIPDAMHLYTLERVVVVYPAGPGEDVEKNRSSAERRVRFLDKVRGVRARAVADTQMSEQDRAENLVLLGWTNRVLGGAAAPSPFARTASGFTFLGIEHKDPSADLMFFCYSPFRSDKRLFFWSRIEPEMDRFLALPAIGSNWAIYRDFLPVRQGMFRGVPDWPPIRNEDAESDRTEMILELETLRAVRRSEHYDIYYLPSESLALEMDTIVKAREAAFARAVAVLGAPAEGFRIRLFLYQDEVEKEERSGVEDPAHSLPGQRELHLVQRLARNAACHEEIHLLARQVLGPCLLTSLYEGLALSVDGTYGGTPLGVYAAMFLESAKLPSLDVLLREGEARALGEKTLFPAAGLLGGWLRSLGPDALRPAYTLGGEGVDALAKVLDTKARSLESSFKEYVKESAKAHAGELVFLKEQMAAQERYRTGDYAGVIAALDRALKAKPDDPQTLFNLASAQVRTGAYDAADKNLKRILALKVGKRDAHLVIFTHYQLGRLYDIEGRREEAVARYRRVLELPDQKDAHRLAREALEKPITKEQLD